ncbi:uncharacterized protein EAE97_010698 [Botrytis byssoidea]|uniref:Uncharacterized protein n=1 Tax=Botrytis byssoidea TaxID=139641 RepID=A0A9P5I6M5_9HELO|nr:uncharacterized protein EAE97_010698 [Botrytis byssoidea]KAF7924747.1 hypothetical protein EAE97_010698 [Botrytis byssoidea]
MPEIQLPPLFIKIEQSLPYIISPILLFSLVLPLFINIDKSNAHSILLSQISFSGYFCYYFYRQPNTPHRCSSLEALVEKAN